MFRLLFAFSLMLAALPAFTSAVQAASFDCSKASSFFEKTICGDPSLSAADETLAVAYATALGGLSSQAADRVRADQRSWLDFASRLCTQDAQPMSAGNFPLVEGAYSSNCLQSEFTSRIGVLEGSRMMGKLRIYPVSAYAVFVDPEADPEDAWRVGHQAFSAPRIDGQTPEAKAFNSFVDTKLGDFATTLAAAGPTGRGLETGSDEDADLKVTAVLPSRITVERTDSSFGHGAAHGEYAITYLHFLREEQRALMAEDVFSGEDWQAILTKAVTDELHREIAADDLMLSDDTDLTLVVTDPQRWDFTDKALLIQFQPYEVSYYAYGAPTVRVPWAQLSGITTEQASTIAAGY